MLSRLAMDMPILSLTMAPRPRIPALQPRVADGTSVPAPTHPRVHAHDGAVVSDLVARAAAGDEAAYAALYERFSLTVFKYALARCGDRELAEDLLAETFVTAWKRLPDYHFTGAPFVTWLLAIAARHQMTAARSAARKPTTSLDERSWDAPDEGVDAAAALADRDEVARLLGNLPEDQRQVLTLRFFADQSADEIAQALGKTSANVRQLQLRALQEQGEAEAA